VFFVVSKCYTDQQDLEIPSGTILFFDIWNEISIYIYIYINNDLSVKNYKSHLAGTLEKEYRD